MRARKLVLVGVALLIAASVAAGNLEVKPYVLFGGSNTSAAVDTVEQVSPWIPIRGAQRIILRTWTVKSAFGLGTEADRPFLRRAAG